MPRRAFMVIVALGVALTVVGWSDLLLLWLPAGFGSAEWEFGTVSAYLDGLPLGTIGVGILAVSMVGTGRKRTLRTLSVAAGGVAVFTAGAFLLYLLNVPVALGGVAPELRPVLNKAVVKAAIFASVYVAFYGWLSRWLWKAPSRSRKHAR